MEYRYDPQVEQSMRVYYETLGEKDRRRYAAVEAEKLPYGGIVYIAQILGCAARTIRRGIKELRVIGQEGDPAEGRERREGAGRPKKASAVRK